jgi:uncharacterized caspase-like protein
MKIKQTGMALAAILAALLLPWSAQAQQKHPLVTSNGAYTNSARLNNPAGDAGDMAVPAGAQVKVRQKYALAIGNGAYTNIAKLNNPVNDANDMEAALKELGFTVEKILDGSLDQMNKAAARLWNRLSASSASYGFLFYAGHALQSGGESYLLPVDAHIPRENNLRQQAVPVQTWLYGLGGAGNELNIVVLDASRGNEFDRSGGVPGGLSVKTHYPANSIVVYATGAGSTAADGAGRNGLFTGHLLTNIKTPGLDVKTLFDRTRDNVANASGNKQRPEVYNQFVGTAYLGITPLNSPR